ncbi:glycosyltransferase [Jatrophihabitans fulvus]
MIGYYVHHVGRGHLVRATAIARHLGDVTVLSSLPRPDGWEHGWVDLPLDTDGSDDPTANGRLHWVPRYCAGLRERSNVVSSWIAQHDPDAFVVDVSVEIALLARLHGVPVVSMVLPGDRSDAAHRLGFDVAAALVAPWPDLAGTSTPRVHHVGAISRFDGRARERAPGDRTVVLLGGLGGGGPALPPDGGGWRWTRLGGDTWVDDPWPALCAADVVVTHCGLGALADVAAARRPAVLLPQTRPHGEQLASARALADARVAVVCEAPPSRWEPVLERAVDLGGGGWSLWSSGEGAARAAAVIRGVAR